MKPDIKWIALLFSAINPILSALTVIYGPAFIVTLVKDRFIFSGKIELAMYVGVLFSALIMIFVILTISFRIIYYRVNPLYKEDPIIIKTC